MAAGHVGGCFKNKNRHCSIEDDGLNEILGKAFEADGIIIGSPTYFSNVTTEVKAFIDRCGYVSKANNNLLISFLVLQKCLLLHQATGI